MDLRALLPLCLAASLGADVSGCACDVAIPQTLAARECALCRVAEEQPADPPVFFLKDNNPRKPNRLLVLPRAHGKAQDSLSAMTPQQRLMLWTAAIEKARSLWGDKWGLAVNGDSARTQCHAHMHIGKLLPDAENDRFVLVDGPVAIPAPNGGEGIWIHSAGAGLHAHLGEPAGELKLLR